MHLIVTLVAVVSGIYGLCWLIFTFTDPPPSLAAYFRAPQAMWFLPDRVARFLMAVIFLGVLPFTASMLISFMLRN